MNRASSTPGRVAFVGSGPGDPGLLTLDALAGLAQADVIVHDALVDARVLALANPKAQLEFAGKRGGRPSVQQADITARLTHVAGAQALGMHVILFTPSLNLEGELASLGVRPDA